jgi:predicted lipoprotein with Yx(FWY)xxD motif
VTRATTVLVAAAAAVLAAVLVLILVSRSGPAHVRRPAAARVADVQVAHNRLGRILVDRRGRTLYLFATDRHGRSACAGGCARVWPPLTVLGAPLGGEGVSAAKLTTTLRADHRRQVVYDGHPLYTMSADTRPGQTAGQGFLGAWFVVSPSGRQIGRGHASAEGGY